LKNTRATYKKNKNPLKQKTQVRFQCSIEVQLVIDRLANQENTTKSVFLETLLMNNEMIKKELKYLDESLRGVE